jgi:aminotransferase
LVNNGDEVLIPQPSFVCYEPITALAGGVPVTIELKAENNFVLTPEQIEEKITDKTKILILPKISWIQDAKAIFARPKL